MKFSALGCSLFAVFFATTAVGQQAPTKRDLKEFAVWSDAVRRDYILYRSLEDDLLLDIRKLPPGQVRSSLTNNLHQDLEPAVGASVRLIHAGKNYDAVDTCRIAIRRFRAVADTAQRVNTVHDKPYPSDATDYLKSAEACERGIKFPPHKSQFRDVARVLSTKK